jgi:hypothetical protein
MSRRTLINTCHQESPLLLSLISAWTNNFSCIEEEREKGGHALDEKS